MIKRKCSSCGRNVRKEFNYCPYCGASLKMQREQEDFGFLGRDDHVDNFAQREVKLPFGLNRIMNSLIKQLESQLKDINFEEMDNGKGFRIKITSNQIPVEQPPLPEENPAEIEFVDEFDESLANLPVVDAKTKIKRIADRIIYEIETPGVRKKENVKMRKLAEGFELRAYSKNKCYVKFIPLNTDLLSVELEKGKVVVELRG